MEALAGVIGNLISDHWAKVLLGGLLTCGSWVLARRKADAQWKRREFFHRVNFSLNTIVDETLCIRTLAEKPCSEVFLNEVAERQLVDQAALTTPGDPFIPLTENDSWFFLNAVLNELSEQFAAGLIAREAGRPVTAHHYLVCLTNECDGDLRTRKIRALVTRRSLLENLPKKTPKFESPSHAVRWRTLKQMAERRLKEPWRFLEVELVS